MPLRLILVRHAKSAWGDASLDDFDRPLVPRGRRAAVWIGEVLRAEAWLPERVICSTAERTRQTLDLAGFSGSAVSYDRQVYDLMSKDYVELIRAHGKGQVFMLVGHNMATTDTATALLANDMGIADFTTGAIAVIDFDVADWAAVEEGTGQLVAFRKPPKG